MITHPTLFSFLVATFSKTYHFRTNLRQPFLTKPKKIAKVPSVPIYYNLECKAPKTLPRLLMRTSCSRLRLYTTTKTNARATTNPREKCMNNVDKSWPNNLNPESRKLRAPIAEFRCQIRPASTLNSSRARFLFLFM